MDIDGAAVAEIIKAPDLVEQLIAREDAVRAGGQMVKEFHLLGRRFDALAVNDEFKRVKIDDQLVEDQASGLRLVVLTARAAQNSLNSRQQFLHFKGLGEIVIRALLESLHLVVCFALCCEHDHRGLAVLPDGAQDVPAVHHGQHDIEQHQIGPKLPKQVNALSAIGGDPGVVALFFKIHLDKFSDIRIVFDDQDCFCHRRSTLPSDTI